LLLIWPARNFDVTSAKTEAPAAPQSLEAQPPPVAERQQPVKRRVLQYNELEDGIQLLPSYARSLLKVRVPVRVILASTKLPLQRVEELGPGSIIQFRKSCDETLSLEVGGCTVAAGEAVKVGDKFGLWITSIEMPAEDFDPIRPASTGE
jgi:flagellar motor switch/type III secretory pathway protein FliN